MPASAPDHFTCQECGRTLPKAPGPEADEAAHAEAVRNFGKRGDAPGMAIVCDDCYRAILARLNG